MLVAVIGRVQVAEDRDAAARRRFPIDVELPPRRIEEDTPEHVAREQIAALVVIEDLGQLRIPDQQIQTRRGKIGRRLAVQFDQFAQRIGNLRIEHAGLRRRIRCQHFQIGDLRRREQQRATDLVDHVE